MSTSADRDHGGNSPMAMDLGTETHIVADLRTGDGEQALQRIVASICERVAELATRQTELLRRLRRRGPLRDAVRCTEAVVLYAVVPRLAKPVAWLGRSSDGVVIGESHGQPASLLFVLLAPERQAVSAVGLITAIGRVLSDPVCRSRLASAPNEKALREALRACLRPRSRRRAREEAGTGVRVKAPSQWWLQSGSRASVDQQWQLACTSGASVLPTKLEPDDSEDYRERDEAGRFFRDLTCPGCPESSDASDRCDFGSRNDWTAAGHGPTSPGAGGGWSGADAARHYLAFARLSVAVQVQRNLRNGLEHGSLMLQRSRQHQASQLLTDLLANAQHR